MTKNLFFLMAVAALLSSCGNRQGDSAANIGKSHARLDSDLMTPEVLWQMGRVSDIQVSPDGQEVLYGVSYYSVPDNKGNRDLFVVRTDGGETRQLSSTPESEQAATWSADGKKIYFLSAAEGSMQLWEMTREGKNRRRLTDFDKDIEAYAFSPDGSRLLFVSQVKYGQSVQDIYPDLDKSSGRIINDLMYKHWDEWVETVPHPFVADFRDGRLENVRDLLEGEPYESPMKPFGGIEQLAWSPDGKTVAYTCRKKTGLEYAVSTNSDIYLCHVEEGFRTENLTPGMGGYDTNPVFSPSGRYLAFSSMAREGYESDKNRLMVLDLQTGDMTDYTASFDQEASSLAWSQDDSRIYFVSVWHGCTHVYELTVATGQIRQVTRGVYDFDNALPAGDCLVALRHSMSRPNEVIRIDPASGEMTSLTHENDEIFDQLATGRVEERWVETTDHRQMLVWVIYPPHFDPARKYPALLFCEGGPQSPVSQFWSYRWNFQLMAANGYIIVAPNRRGLPGFGQEWLEQISGDYGGQNMKDYLSAIDALSAEPYVDEDRLGCVGASYGGFSVYWLAGNHEKRFKAFIAHSGIFNLEQQYVETEEMWFVNWDLGGAYWEKDNAVARRSYANSPHRFIDKWDTPILCIHGEKDYRILASQGMSAFNAAKLRGLDAQLLVFPDENHWILKPQNAILWQRTYFAWLDKYLKK
ncbi:MAG: S9 family peptidase [Bacteroidales bacterium]|nr:S9 family peptidase [Bacteroidales bacterium]